MHPARSYGCIPAGFLQQAYPVFGGIRGVAMLARPFNSIGGAHRALQALHNYTALDVCP